MARITGQPSPRLGQFSKRGAFTGSLRRVIRWRLAGSRPSSRLSDVMRLRPQSRAGVVPPPPPSPTAHSGGLGAVSSVPLRVTHPRVGRRGSPWLPAHTGGAPKICIALTLPTREDAKVTRSDPLPWEAGLQRAVDGWLTVQVVVCTPFTVAWKAACLNRGA